MVLRLDPRLPVVWRTPTSIQFGISLPVVIMHDVTIAAERMIAALEKGVTDAGVAMIGQSAGASAAEVVELLAALRPALLPPRESRLHRVLIVGTGTTTQRLVQVLASAGFDVWIAGDVAAAEAQDCDFAIAVGHFVIDPSLYGIWLRRDIPHLGVVLSDAAVSIGPLIQPGRSACLYCLQFYATESDPAWPAMASQLWGRRSLVDTELVASEVAARAARIVIGWFQSSPHNQQETLDVASGQVSTAEFLPHPSCGCLQPGVANALATAPTPQGTGLATAAPGVLGPTTPTAPTRG